VDAAPPAITRIPSPKDTFRVKHGLPNNRIFLTGVAVAKLFCERRCLFEKRLSSFAPHLPKTFDGIAFIVNDKSNSDFLENDQ